MTPTKIQAKFIAALIETVKQDEELLIFARTACSGKTTALKEFDKILRTL